MSIVKKYYTRALMMTLSLSVSGFLIQLIWQSAPTAWAFPLNIMFLMLLVVVCIILTFYYNSSRLYRFFTHSDTSLGVMSGFLFLLILLGVTPQLPVYEIPDGLSSVAIFYRKLTTSFPFCLNLLLILFIVLLVILKQKPRWSFRYLSFQINHIGLWLALTAGFMGAADRQEYKILLEPERLNQDGFTLRGQAERLPFSFMINDFSIERYPDQLLLLDKPHGTIIEKACTEFVRKEGECRIGEKQLTILRAEESGVEFTYDNAPSAVLLTQDKPYFGMSDGDLLFWKPGKPRQYTSRLSIEYNNKVYQEEIAVNFPIIIDNYYLYMESYEHKPGFAFPKILLRIVKDPWIQVAYAGLWLMMTGAVLLIMTGPVYMHKVKPLKLQIND